MRLIDDKEQVWRAKMSQGGRDEKARAMTEKFTSSIAVLLILLTPLSVSTALDATL